MLNAFLASIQMIKFFLKADALIRTGWPLFSSRILTQITTSVSGPFTLLTESKDILTMVRTCWRWGRPNYAHNVPRGCSGQCGQRGPIRWAPNCQDRTSAGLARGLVIDRSPPEAGLPAFTQPRPQAPYTAQVNWYLGATSLATFSSQV